MKVSMWQKTFAMSNECLACIQHVSGSCVTYGSRFSRCCRTSNSYQQPVTSVTLRAFDMLCFISFTPEALEGIRNTFNTFIGVPGRRDLAMLMKDKDIWPQVGQWVRANHGSYKCCQSMFHTFFGTLLG